MRFITSDDINRIKESVATVDSFSKSNDLAERKNILKKKSDSRVATWSDTLESKRKEKLRWKQEMQDQEEAKRVEMDKAEEALRKKSLETILNRSKEMKYEENERVRFLRSQQLYTEVIETRDEQLREKAHLEETRRREENEWHDVIMETLKKSEALHNQKVSAAKQKAIANAKMMEQQKKQAALEKRNKLEMQRKEELEILHQIEEENKDFKEKELQRRKTAKERSKLEMEKVAMDAKVKQQLDCEVEKAEQEKRDKDIARMNFIAKTRTTLEKKHFEEKQKARRILSEKASQELELRAAKEIEIFIRDQKAKESLDQKRKHDEEQLKKQLEDELHKSRQSQILAKADRYYLQRQKEKEIAEREHQRCLNELQKEKEDQMIKKRINYEYRKHLEEQISSKEKARMSVIEAERAENEKTMRAIKEEENMFKEFALREMEKFQQQGKSAKLLSKAIV